MKEKNIDEDLKKEIEENEDIMANEEDFYDDEIIAEYEEDIEEYEKQIKKDRRDKIILIIIIIILLLLHLLCHKLGKIGYKQNISTNAGSLDDFDKVEFDVVEILDGDVKNIKDSQLNIFKNQAFNGEKIIAPRSNGEYKFCVENLVDGNITYDIKFSDEMTNPINMKYKLKIDNVYIKGNEKEYVDIEDLNVEDIIVLDDSNNIYTLEWKWEDDDVADTFVGEQEETQSYTLKLTIDADNLQK